MTLSIIPFCATATYVGLYSVGSVPERALTALICGVALAFSLSALADLSLFGVWRLFERFKK